jgi:hypothetical protein
MKKWLQKFLIPNADNDYKPHALQKFAVSVMLFLVVSSFTVANIQTLVMLGSDWFVSTILPGVLVDLTNNNRKANTLGVLQRNTLLDEAARRKAEHMAEHSYFAHHSPDGISPWYWIEQAGYVYLHAGENLAVHFTESSEVVDAWMNSPGHRANILNGNYTEIGIGTARGEYKGFPTIFVVQLFGTPSVFAAAPTPQSEPVPAPPTPTVAQAVPTVPQAPLATNTGVPTVASTSPVLALESPAPTSPTATAPREIIPPAVASEEVTGTGDIATSTIAEMVEEAEEEESGRTVVLYSEMSTSSPIVATGPILSPSSGTTPQSIEPQVGPALHALTTPTIWLSWLYLVLGIFVLCALALSIVIEWRRQHPVQIAYGFGLVALLVLMFNVREFLVGGVLIL